MRIEAGILPSREPIGKVRGRARRWACSVMAGSLRVTWDRKPAALRGIPVSFIDLVWVQNHERSRHVRDPVCKAIRHRRERSTRAPRRRGAPSPGPGRADRRRGPRAEPAARDLPRRASRSRSADYARPETLAEAFAGIDRVLLISSSEVGQRVPQHRNVIEAAGRAGVGLIAYTSLLHADTSPLGLAEEHRATEAILRSPAFRRRSCATAGTPRTTRPPCPGPRPRSRCWEAPVKAGSPAPPAPITRKRRRPCSPPRRGRAHPRTGGRRGLHPRRIRSEAARASGRPFRYQDLPPAEYRAALLGAGLPDGVASLLADSDAGAARGALFDDGHALRTLIGRPTTPLATVSPKRSR